MNPEEQRAFNDIVDRLEKLEKTDRLTMYKTIQMLNGRNMQLGKGAGTKIGTEATQKLGFFNATPVVQQTIAGRPSGGATVDTEARAAINDIIDLLENLGLFTE